RMLEGITRRPLASMLLLDFPISRAIPLPLSPLFGTIWGNCDTSLPLIPTFPHRRILSIRNFEAKCKHFFPTGMRANGRFSYLFSHFHRKGVPPLSVYVKL